MASVEPACCAGYPNLRCQGSTRGGECHTEDGTTLCTRLAAPARRWAALMIRVGPTGAALADPDISGVIAAAC